MIWVVIYRDWSWLHLLDSVLTQDSGPLFADTEMQMLFFFQKITAVNNFWHFMQ